MGIKNKNKRLKNQNGSITIYLALTLLLVLILVLTVIESGRVSAINAKLRGITYTAVDSCFSQYAREVFDEYGIMVLWRDEAEFMADFDNYIQKNIGITDLDINEGSDFYAMSYDGGAIAEVEWITDKQGQVFENQVCDYMKYHLAEGIIEQLLLGLDIFGKGNGLEGFIEKLNGFLDVFSSVEDAAEKLQKKVDLAKGYVNNPKAYLGYMKQLVNDYEKVDAEFYAAQFEINKDYLIDSQEDIAWTLTEVKEKADIYGEKVSEAQDAVDELQAELESNSDVYSEEVYEMLQTQLDELRKINSDSEDGYYNVAEKKAIADEYLLDVSSVDLELNLISDGLNHDNAEYYKSIITVCENYYSGVDIGELDVAVMEESEEKESGGFLSTIGEIIGSGFLSAVTTGTISGEKISTKNLPSKTTSNSGEYQSVGIIEATINKALCSEYVVEHFGNYREPLEDTALKYEVEYIIGGKESDKENLEIVARNLLLMRSGLNCISLMGDAQKMSEIESLALSIACFTGIPILKVVFEMLIIAAWSTAEALYDVKALLAGEKVSTVKSSMEWNLSINGLKNFAPDAVKAVSTESGLEYVDYLRLMLLMQNKNQLLYRSMDAIQVNMCKRENINFDMTKCISAIKLEVQYEAPQVFTAFRLVVNKVGMGNGKYSFKYNQEFSY